MADKIFKILGTAIFVMSILVTSCEGAACKEDKYGKWCAAQTKRAAMGTEMQRRWFQFLCCHTYDGGLANTPFYCGPMLRAVAVC